MIEVFVLGKFYIVGEYVVVEIGYLVVIVVVD